MPLLATTLLDQFATVLELQHFAGPLEGVQVEGLNSPEQAGPQSLAFASEAKHLKALRHRPSPPAVLIVSPPLAKALQAEADPFWRTCCLIQCPNVSLALAQIARAHFDPGFSRRAFLADQPIHPTAVIHPSAQVADSAVVGPHTVIGPDVILEAQVVVGSHCHLEAGVHVGQGSHIHSHVYLGPQTQLGKLCEIHPMTSIGTEGFGYAHDSQGEHHRIPHLGRVVLQDRVHIGSNVSMDRGTLDDSVVGAGTKIDNHCHFGHNFRCGKNCLITGGFISAGSVTLGDRVVVGGRTTISGHLEVASGVQLAGLSGVPKSLNEAGAYGGYPPQPVKEHLRTTSTLTHLPQMRKDISRILKHLKLES